MKKIKLDEKEIKLLITSSRIYNNEDAYNKLLNYGMYYVNDIIDLRFTRTAYDRELLLKIGISGIKDFIKTYDIALSNDYVSYLTECIYNKIHLHLQKNPKPTVLPVCDNFMRNVARELNVLIPKDKYINVRFYIEMLPVKVRKCILLRYGYDGKMYNEKEISAKIGTDEETIINVLDKFKMNITKDFENVASVKKSTNISEDNNSPKPENSNQNYPKKEVLSKVSELSQESSAVHKSAQNLEKELLNKQIKCRNLSEKFKGYDQDTITSYKIHNNKDDYNKLLNHGMFFVNSIIDTIFDKTAYDRDLLLKIGISGIKDAIKSYDITSTGDYISHLTKCIYDKIYLHLQKNPEPTLLPDCDNFIKTIARELNVLIPKDKYINVRFYIEMLPVKVRKCILLRYGYDGKMYNEKEISAKIGTNEETIINVLDKFKLNITKYFEQVDPVKKLMSIIGDNNRAKQNISENSNRKKYFFECFPDFTKDEVLSKVSELSQEEQAILHKKYGLNLDEYHSITRYENGKNSPIISKIKNKLNNKSRKPKLFFEHFPGCTKEEVLNKVQELSQEEQAILYKRYGTNLDEHHSLTKNETSKLTNIISKIKRKLNNKSRKLKLFFEYFPDFTKEEVLSNVSELSQEEQAMLHKKYGQNLDEYYSISKEENGCIFNIITKIKNILNNKSRKLKLFFEYFPDYTREEVLSKVSELSQEEQTMLHKKYGLNLEEYHSVCKEESINLSNIILTIKRKLNNKPKKVKLFFEYFPGYTREEVLSKVSELSQEEQAMLHKKYGANLEEFYSTTQRENNIVHSIIQKLENRLLNKQVKCRNFFEKFKDYDRDLLLDVIKNLPADKQAILYKKYGLNLDEYHSISKEETINLSNIILTIKRKLNKKPKKVKLFFEYFPGYTKEEVLSKVAELFQEEQAMLHKKYGINLDEYHSINKKENKKVNNAIMKIKNKLINKSRKLKRFFEYFPNYTREEVLSKVSELSPEELTMLYKKFGTNLDEYHSIPQLENTIVQKIIRKIENRLLGKKIRYKYFFDKFKDYDRDLLLDVVKNLTANEQALLYKKYGLNLDEYHSISKEEKNDLSNLMIKIKRKLTIKPKRHKLFFEYFPKFSKEDVLIAVSELSPEEQAILHKKYGIKLDEYYSLTNEETQNLSNLIVKIIRKLNRKFVLKTKEVIKPEDKVLLYKTDKNSEENHSLSDLDNRETEIVLNKLEENLEKNNKVLILDNNFEFDNLTPVICEILKNNLDITIKDALIFIIKIISLEKDTFNIDYISKQFGLSEDESNKIALEVLEKLNDEFSNIYSTLLGLLNNKNNLEQGHTLSLKPKSKNE